jgi:hypothetical protein
MFLIKKSKENNHCGILETLHECNEYKNIKIQNIFNIVKVSKSI